MKIKEIPLIDLPRDRKNPTYIDVILQRYYNETGQSPTRESDGAKFPIAEEN